MNNCTSTEFTFLSKFCFKKIQTNLITDNHIINVDDSLQDELIKFFRFTCQVTAKSDPNNFINTKQINQFFLLKYKTSIYFILCSQSFLKENWNKEIINCLKTNINIFLNNLLKIKSQKYKLPSNFEATFLKKDGYELTDLTYYNPNKTVYPRRIRTIGGAIRRVFNLIKIDIKKNNFVELDHDPIELKKSHGIFQKKCIEKELDCYNLKIQTETLLGGQKEFDHIYIAVKHKKKLNQDTKKKTVIENNKIFSLSTQCAHENDSVNRFNSNNIKLKNDCISSQFPQKRKYDSNEIYFLTGTFSPYFSVMIITFILLSVSVLHKKTIEYAKNFKFSLNFEETFFGIMKNLIQKNLNKNQKKMILANLNELKTVIEFEKEKLCLTQIK